MYQLYSPNMLKTFELCPKKFYFRYVKNVSMPTNDEIFELGKNIHALASYYLKKEELSKMELSLSERERHIWDYLRSVKYFSYETVISEQSLSVKVGDYFFGGRLDAVVRDGEKFYILDYKTGSAPKNAKYDYQTMIYLLAVKAFYKTDNVVFVYLDLKNKEEIEIKLTNSSVNEYENKLIEVAQKIEQQDFFAFNKKADRCACEYNIICY